jgi:thiosulfate dehydrogenase [quinone] large subunit
VAERNRTHMANSETFDRALAHGLARLALGVDIVLHGLTRLPKLAAFAGGMEKEFAKTLLPGSLVYLTGYGIAIGEAIIGALLLLGIFLRPTLVAGMLLMLLLLSGVGLLQNWNIAALQLSYVAFYAALLATASWDRYSVDGWLRGRKKG